jgi:16S rRNA (uracil1498-N3)-methyltransferase
MPSFLIAHEADPGEKVRLSPEESRHLRDVLRIEVGDKIRLFEKTGTQYSGVVKEISKKEVTVMIEEKTAASAQNHHLKIAQAFLKREKMEFVIQKAVELGIDSLHPFSSERTIATAKKPEKLDRWKKIADEASKQCGRGSEMTIDIPASFDAFLQNVDADLKLIFWEEETKSLQEFLKSPLAPLFQRGVGGISVLAMIGPEGGFSTDEVEAARAAGFVPLSLGPRILRAETAAIAVMSLLQYEMGNL